MMIGVVSDTHGHTHLTLHAVRVLEALQVDRLIHCGDIGSTGIPTLFDQWQTHYVLGNVDVDLPQLPDAIGSAGGIFHDRFGEVHWQGRRIAFLHGDDAPRLKQERQSGSWDLVCSGHTHKSLVETVGPTLVLNPGAVFRARPHTIAVVDLEQLEATIVPIDP